VLHTLVLLCHIIVSNSCRGQLSQSCGQVCSLCVVAVQDIVTYCSHWKTSQLLSCLLHHKPELKRFCSAAVNARLASSSGMISWDQVRLPQQRSRQAFFAACEALFSGSQHHSAMMAGTPREVDQQRSPGGSKEPCPTASTSTCLPAQASCKQGAAWGCHKARQSTLIPASACLLLRQPLMHLVLPTVVRLL
jgi:hypothetical protein